MNCMVMKHETAAALARKALLEGIYGQVWDTQELLTEFWILGFSPDGDVMHVQRKSDKQTGFLDVEEETGVLQRLHYHFVEEKK